MGWYVSTANKQRSAALAMSTANSTSLQEAESKATGHVATTVGMVTAENADNIEC